MPVVELPSIFETVKKFCSVDLDSGAFDQDLILLTNGALFALKQIGIGPSTGFKVTGTEELWTDFLGENTNLEAAKQYVCMRVRLIFDPNSVSAAALQAYKDTMTELEWRLSLEGEPYVPIPPVS